MIRIWFLHFRSLHIHTISKIVYEVYETHIDGVSGGIVIGAAVKGRLGHHDGLKYLIPYVEPGICYEYR